MAKDSKRAGTALRATHTTSYSEVRLRTASAKSVAATTVEQPRMQVIEPFEAGCRLATQQTSGSCRVPPQSRRDTDGGPTARTP